MSVMTEILSLQPSLDLALSEFLNFSALLNPSEKNHGQ